MKTKICTQCGKRKLLDKFTKRNNRPNGYRSACKVCEKQRYSSRNKAWRDAHREQYKGQTTLWRLRNIYGIEPEWLEIQYAKQCGKCAICGVAFDLSIPKLSPCVDHDHNNGRVRGLLCRNCNRAIGLLNDSPILLLNAAKYLLVN